MYMFDQNGHYKWQIVAPIVAPIIAPTHIKQVHSSLLYQLATYPKYDRCVRASPHGYGP